jgi:sec-independent protein translocase protein TatC
MPNDPQRPLRVHLEELRKRLFIVVLVVLLGASVSVVFFSQIVDLLLVPSQERLSGTGDGRLVYTELTELLAVTVKVALLGGFVLALPVTVYQIMMFVAPGLTRRERRLAFLIVPAAPLAFAAGAAFAYSILLPPILRFLLSYGSDIAVPMIRVTNYVNVMVTMVFWMGLVFQTPILMFVLAKTGVVAPNTMAQGRRYIVVLAFVMGAIITPTFDPLNQAAVAAPLIVLYEIGLWIAKLTRWERKSIWRRNKAQPTAKDG